jgi:cystathionine gamma-synthase
VSFEIRGDFQATSKFIDALRIPYIAPSLGGVEALVMQPAVMSYWDHSPEERAQLGIKDNLIRYACGLEDADDLIRDAEQALERI